MNPVGAFYERHPYPPPSDDVPAYRKKWDDVRRRADSHLFWPGEPHRDDRSILVAGCGTMQAVHYAVRWPNARVVGIDVSTKSISYAQNLKERYSLDNLHVRHLAIEHAAGLGELFDHIVCTGVLHHLSDPSAGLRALRNVLAPRGAMHVMIYAPYGRAGIYMLQEYCRRLRIGTSPQEIADLAQTLRAVPEGHPLAPLLRSSPDFRSAAGIADALLHPQDRAYSVPELMQLVQGAEMVFGRWVRQAPYSPGCGAPARTPHREKLEALPTAEQYAALELLRGTMVRHSFIAYRSDCPPDLWRIDFEDDAALEYVPVRLPDTVAVRDGVPEGAVAVLINRTHTDTDLYLPVDAEEEGLLARANAERTIAGICSTSSARSRALRLFSKLWRWDQIVFDTSQSRRPIQ